MLVCPLCRLTLSDNETTCPRDGHEGVEARATEVPAPVRARFAIVEPYAQGASGELYIADDQQTGRRGVLKLLRLPSGVTPAEKARLKREIVKQATLGAGALSAPLATGDADGRPWIFREWHDGVSLAVKLARGGALAVPEALAIAAEVASALDVLHRSGLLHRDLKPGHVIVEPQPSGVPRVSVIDAGIASRIDTASVFAVMGTPEYLSPEQATGKLVSFRSDLYALGCMLYEMLAGTPPFSGGTEELLKAHAEAPAPTPPVSLPVGVSTLLSQLLAKEPRERPFSAQQVRRALEPFLPEDASSKRESTQTFDRVPAGPRSTPATGTGTLRPPRSTKRTAVGMPAQKSVPPPPPPAARKKASIPPPPPGSAGRVAKRPDPTMELSPLDLEEAEAELGRSPRKPRVAKTLMGVAAPSAAGEATQELSSLDLEEAEEALGAPSAAPRVNRTILGMPAQPTAAQPAVTPPPSPTQASPATGAESGSGAGPTQTAAGWAAPISNTGSPSDTASPSSPGATPSPSTATPSGTSPVSSPGAASKSVATLGSLTGEPISKPKNDAADRSAAAFAPTSAMPQTSMPQTSDAESSSAAFAPTGAMPQTSTPHTSEAESSSAAFAPTGAMPQTSMPQTSMPQTSDAEARSREMSAATQAKVPPPEAGPTATSPGLGEASAPTPMGTTSPGFADAPVPATGAPPWQSQSLHPSEAPPPGPAEPDEGGLDYDDLAETVAFDRERYEEEEAAAAHANAARADAPPGAPSPFPATPAPATPAPSHPGVRDAQPVAVPGMRRTLPLVALAAVAGICMLSVVAGGVGLWLFSGGDEPQDPIASGAVPSTTPQPVPAPVPMPAPSPTPPAASQPAPPAQDPVQEPAADDLAVADTAEPAEEPVEEPAQEPETVEQETASEPAAAQARAPRAQPREERQPREQAAPRRRPQQQASSGGTRLERFNALREEALTHFRARRYAQAATAYEGATRLNPRHAGSFAGLGASRMQQRQYGPAIQAYSRAAQLQPRHAGFQAALGRAYQLSGDRNRARQAYQRALSLDANNSAAQQGLRSLGG